MDYYIPSDESEANALYEKWCNETGASGQFEELVMKFVAWLMEQKKPE